MERTSETLSPIVLGAIAIGSCALAACDDPAPRPEIEPIAAATPIAVVEEEPDEVLLDADSGRVGTLEAGPGFTPDPMTRAGAFAGGTFDASEIDERCAGWIGAEPDFVLEARRPFAELAVMAASEADTTLFVVDPDGEARCDDDGEGPHPIVRGAWEVGLYRVWVGTKARGASGAYVLGLSELDDTMPSSLLH